MFSKKEPEWHWMPSLEIWVWWVKDLLWPAVRPNYIHSTSNDIHTDGLGIRLGDRRFKGIGLIIRSGRQEIQGDRANYKIRETGDSRR